jgi:hypothetical protein
MRERDLKALEFDKVIALVAQQAISVPGRRAVACAPRQSWRIYALIPDRFQLTNSMTSGLI